MIVKSLDNALYVVEDLEEAIRFYRDVLALKLKFKTKNYAELDTGNSAIALLKRGTSWEDQDVPVIGGNAVICFETENIETTKAQLEAKGAKILGDIFEDEHIRLLVFEDLYGNHMHIYEPK